MSESLTLSLPSLSLLADMPAVERMSETPPPVLKEYPKHYDDVFCVEQGEYAVTRADDRHPSLATFALSTCKGLLLYEPDAKLLALAHIDYIDKLNTCWDEMLEKLDELGGKKYRMWLSQSGERDDDIASKALIELIKMKSKKLKQEGKLLSVDDLPFREFVFDAREGEFYSFNDALIRDDAEREKKLDDRVNGKTDRKIHCVYEPKAK